MGVHPTKQSNHESSQNIVLRRTSSSYHNLNSPRDHHKEYIWKKWKFCNHEKSQQLLAKLNQKLNNPKQHIISVLDVEFTKTNKQVYKIRSKIQFSERSLKSQIQERKLTLNKYPLQQIWNYISQFCQMAIYCQSKDFQLSQNLSNYMFFDDKIKMKDQQLIPEIKESRTQVNYSKSICRIIANIALLTLQQNQVTILQISRINLRYNANLATFLYRLKQENLNLAQISNLCKILRQENRSTQKITFHTFNSLSFLKTISDQNQQSRVFIPISNQRIQARCNPITEKLIKKCTSDQKFTNKKAKRIQQIKPKQLKKMKMSIPETQFKNQKQAFPECGGEQNKQNNPTANNIKNQPTLNLLSSESGNRVDVEDHNFPKKIRQFLRTSTTAQSDVVSSKNVDIRSSQAMNEAFMKLTGGSKCELFNQNDDNQELLESIIESQQSIIIRNCESPGFEHDLQLDLIGQFAKMDNQMGSHNQKQHKQQKQPEQAKSVIEFGFHRNSTIMEVTQQNEESGQIQRNPRSYIRSPIDKQSQSHISQFQLDGHRQEQKFVVEQYEGGSRYEGYILKGLRNGFGKLYYQDGGSYEGSWKNGEIEGFGKLYYQSGDLAYEGYWLKGEFHGQGKIINEHPDQIQGSFNYYDFSEVGIAWTWYEGAFQHDHKNGNGVLMLSNGQLFTGSWINNNVQGEGIFVTQQNKKIKGKWENNILVEINQIQDSSEQTISN